MIEGAGSPAEINLKQDDIVNMGLAALVNAPVILAGDIDRGGVFAQLYGTVALLEEAERKRIIGTVINKFRGDVGLLTPGLTRLEELTGVPVLGVVPYMVTDIDDEDSLAPCLSQGKTEKPLDIAVIRLPRISNFTDLSPLQQHPAMGVRYVKNAGELGNPDCVILPGTKNTMGDLEWLRQNGLEASVRKLASGGTMVLGICGGYQMMGTQLEDPEGVEHGGTMKGMGLLPCRTVFTTEKRREQVSGTVLMEALKGAAVTGYEIHMGRTISENNCPFLCFPDGHTDGTVFGRCVGTYFHGLFDSGELTAVLADRLLREKGLDPAHVQPETRAEHLEKQYDMLADTVRKSLDMNAIYRAMEEYS